MRIIPQKSCHGLEKKMRLPEGTGQRAPEGQAAETNGSRCAAGPRSSVAGAPVCTARHVSHLRRGRRALEPDPAVGPEPGRARGAARGGRRGGFLPAPETRRLAHPASRELSTRLPVSPLEFLEQKYLLNPLSKCQTGKNKKEKAKEGVSPATKSASFATP